MPKTKTGGKSAPKEKTQSGNIKKEEKPKTDTEDPQLKEEADEGKATEQAKPSAENPNEDICNKLLELADWERNAAGQTFKGVAYKKAARNLAGLEDRYTGALRDPLSC